MAQDWHRKLIKQELNTIVLELGLSLQDSPDRKQKIWREKVDSAVKGAYPNLLEE